MCNSRSHSWKVFDIPLKHDDLPLSQCLLKSGKSEIKTEQGNFYYMKMDIHCRIRATDIQGGTNVTQLFKK